MGKKLLRLINQGFAKVSKLLNFRTVLCVVKLILYEKRRVPLTAYYQLRNSRKTM